MGNVNMLCRKRRRCRWTAMSPCRRQSHRRNRLIGMSVSTPTTQPRGYVLGQSPLPFVTEVVAAEGILRQRTSIVGEVQAYRFPENRVGLLLTLSRAGQVGMPL